MRFVTTLTDNYTPGLIALLQSMKEHSQIDFRFVIVTYDQISKLNQDRILSVGVPCEWVRSSDLGRMPTLLTQTDRMIPNFQKPLIWNLPFNEPLIYVDSDILCLNSLSGIEQWDELTVVPRQSRTEPDLSNPSLYHPWNAGVFCFRPSRDRLEGILEQALTYVDPIKFGDQIILNDYFSKRSEEVRFASMAWNMSTRVSHVNPGLFAKEPIRFLHFAHDQKPWLHAIARPWQRRFWFQWQGYHRRGISRFVSGEVVELTVPSPFDGLQSRSERETPKVSDAVAVYSDDSAVAAEVADSTTVVAKPVEWEFQNAAAPISEELREMDKEKPQSADFSSDDVLPHDQLLE